MNTRHLARICAPISLLAAGLLAACGSGDGDPASTAVATSPVKTATVAASPTRPAPSLTPTTESAPPPAATPQPHQPVDVEPTSVPPTAPPPPPPAPTAPPPPPPPPPPRPPSGGPVALTIAGINSTFSPSAAALPAGSSVTLTFDNQDAGVTHDFVVFDPSGGTLAATELAEGPVVQGATFSLGAPGAYTFKCSVHPQQMRGVITAR